MMLMASMWPALLSRLFVSALPKSKQHFVVEIEGRGDHVDAFGLTVDRSAFGGVVAVAHARGDGDAVDLVSADGCRAVRWPRRGRRSRWGRGRALRHREARA